MKYKLSFSMDNAAFEDRGEVPRILREIADKVERGRDGGYIFDSNGNRIGEYGIALTATEQTEH